MIKDFLITIFSRKTLPDPINELSLTIPRRLLLHQLIPVNCVQLAHHAQLKHEFIMQFSYNHISIYCYTVKNLVPSSIL